MSEADEDHQAPGKELATVPQKRAEIARLRSEQPLLGVLREITIDPAVPPHIRLKAAEVGVGYELPRLSATMNHTTINQGIGDRMERLERAHLRIVEPNDAAR